MTGGPVCSRSMSTCLERTAALLAALLVAAPASADPPQEEAQPAQEITVRASARRRDPARVSVSVDEARTVPGAQGDALKVVESLPGVARSAFGSGKLVVWGSAPGDTRVYVDGVEIPALYHPSGLRGTINADLIQRLDLAPGGWGVDHGRALGGLVRLQTRELPKEGIHGSIGADLLDTSATITAAVSDRARVALAGRVSYLDRLLTGVVSPEAGDYFPIPRYRDYQAKVALDLREDEALSFVLLGSGDTLRRSLASPDPAATRSETTDSSFHRFYARYQRAFSDGGDVMITPYFGRDERASSASYGATGASQAIDTFRYGVRAARRAPITADLAVTAGVDVAGSRSSVTRSGSLTVPPREGDIYVFGQPPGADVAADTWSASLVDAAPFVFADLRLGPVAITPGVRVDAFLIEGSRVTPRVGATPSIGSSRLTTAIDPRVSVSFAAGRRVTISASAGLYHQPPAPEELGAVFGTPALTLSRALHLSAAQAVRLTDRLGLEVTGYYKSLDQLVVRSRLPAPRLALGLTQDGEGRSYGAQLLLRQEAWKGFSGWIAYAISRSERWYAGDATRRLLDDDQPHVLTVVASQTLAGFTVGARFRAASGAPRTPVVSSFYDATEGRFGPVFGAQNSTRLPAFYELDLRAEKAFSIGAVTLRLSLNVLNVTYRKNVEEVGYSFDFSQRRYITGLPILAVLGARLEL
jgi:hypothetical protein